MTPLAADPTPSASSSLRPVLFLALGLFAVRFVYLAWLSPYDLSGDEAHYWEWSRRLDLSYTTKGPGVAWSIWAGTAIFGDTELGVRFPALLANLVATLGMGALALCAGGGTRAALIAAALFNLVTGYQILAWLMTIDGPYVACWAMASLAGLCLLRSWRRGDSGWGGAVALGAALGVGFLYKYTALVFLPGFLLALWLDRRARQRGRRKWAAAGVGFLVFLVCISPVILWNQQRGWPTVRHLLGHLAAPGGDQPVEAWSYDPMWTLEYVGLQIGVAGPPIVYAIILGACRAAVRSPHRWPALRYLLCIGLPMFVFYLLISFRRTILGNWPIAGFATLLVPAATWIADGFDRKRHARRIGYISLIYGLILGLGVFVLPLASDVPAVDGLVRRVQGQRDYAMAVHRVIEEERQASGTMPLIIVDRYNRASQLAFYLPGQPRVRCAMQRLGGRRSAYDDFPDTGTGPEDLAGHRAVLVGSDARAWSEKLGAQDVEARSKTRHRGVEIAIYTASFGGESP